MMNLMSEFAELHDDTLLSQLDDLVRRDRGSCARIIAHVAEVDARKLYLDRGAPSMIDYAKRVLGFSDSAAYRRVTAARLVRRFPLLLDRIASGAVHLTALTILGPHLDEENCERLVAAASGKSRLELEALVAPFRAPVPVTPRAVVRVVRMAEAAGTDPKAAGSAAASPTPPRLAYRLSATLSPETKALLDRAAELHRRDIRHRQPFAHGGAATAENLTLLCSAHHRRVSEQQFGKFLVRDEPRGGTGYGNSRQARVGKRAKRGIEPESAATANSRQARVGSAVVEMRDAIAGAGDANSCQAGVARRTMRGLERVGRLRWRGSEATTS
jgi:hypothetical protein